MNSCLWWNKKAHSNLLLLTCWAQHTQNCVHADVSPSLSQSRHHTTTAAGSRTRADPAATKGTLTYTYLAPALTT